MRIIVSVSREGELGVQDVEVDGRLSVQELLALIPRALRWEGHAGYDVCAYPEGKALALHNSLADAGVWDGAWLVFHPASPAQADRSVSGRPPGADNRQEGLHDADQDHA